MSNVFFISDLHLGHAKILQFEPALRHGTCVEEHDQWIEDSWNAVVNKNDVVWVLGDVAFNKPAMERLSAMKGQKQLVMGNHDQFPLDEYLKYFKTIRPSPWPYKRMWLSHCPIHPQELRNRPNVHGHVHSNSVRYEAPGHELDERYFNACVENLAGTPISLDKVWAKLNVQPLLQKTDEPGYSKDY